MAAGRGVSIHPENAELTTVQAAAILNVSRSFLIKLLGEGALPHRKVGKLREREAVLDQLAAQAQEEDMGYPLSG